MHPKFGDRLNALQRERQHIRPPIDNGGGPPHDGDMEARISKLEVIADHTVKTLDAIQRRLDEGIKELRTEMRDVRNDSNINFKWIVGIQVTTLIAFLGILAKAAHLF